MNNDDKELFGIVKNKNNNIKLMLVKSMRNRSCQKWTEHALAEIKNNRLFSDGATCNYIKIYDIQGCKDYFLVLASSKNHISGHCYISEIRKIISEIHDVYVQTIFCKNLGENWTAVNHRNLKELCISRHKEKTLSMLQLLYPSMLGIRKIDQKTAVFGKTEAKRLTDLYGKNKKSSLLSDEYPEDDPVPPCPVTEIICKKWSDSMSTLEKLKFLKKAKFTSAIHPKFSSKK